MNVQLDNVISSIVGETGMKIVRAILSGERDPLTLAKLRHGRIRASEEHIVKSLQGSWREEHLFALKQAVNLYDSYQAAIAECDMQLTRVLGRLAPHDESPVPPRSARRRSSTVDQDDLRKALCRTCGVDLTLIDGIDVGTAMKMISEVGPDLSRFKTVKHFCSGSVCVLGLKSPAVRFFEGPASEPPIAWHSLCGCPRYRRVRATRRLGPITAGYPHAWASPRRCARRRISSRA
jgi:hypothetical protein